MCWLYILENKITGKYYIGSTNNLNRRIKQHLAGNTRTTRILKTYNLIYTEEYKSLLEARLRERKLKKYKSKKYLNWLINSRAASSTPI